MAEIHEGGAFEVERQALRAALRFPDPIAKTEESNPEKRLGTSLPHRWQDHDPNVPVLPPPPDTRLRWRQQADSSSADLDDVLPLLDVIAATVKHLSSSLEELIERVEQLDKRLDAFDKTAERR